MLVHRENHSSGVVIPVQYGARGLGVMTPP